MGLNCIIRFGALAPRLSEQLEEQNLKYKAEDIVHFQRDADAIVQLSVRGILPMGQVEKCRQKLVKKITLHVSMQKAK
jgi:hypothetical protein